MGAAKKQFFNGGNNDNVLLKFVDSWLDKLFHNLVPCNLQHELIVGESDSSVPCCQAVILTESKSLQLGDGHEMDPHFTIQHGQLGLQKC